VNRSGFKAQLNVGLFTLLWGRVEAKHLRFNNEVEQAIVVDVGGDGLDDGMFLPHSPRTWTYQTIARLPATLLRGENPLGEVGQDSSVHLEKVV
jgi:hypothetical protein